MTLEEETDDVRPRLVHQRWLSTACAACDGCPPCFGVCTGGGVCPLAEMMYLCGAMDAGRWITHRARCCPWAWESLMEYRRRPDGSQVQVAERVTFPDGHRAVAGYEIGRASCREGVGGLVV